METEIDSNKNVRRFFNNHNKLCGWWVDGVYRKVVNSEKHRLRVMNAYGIDKVIVDELTKLHTTEIRIKEEDTGVIWKVDFQHFVDTGVERNLDTPQVFLPVRYFQMVK